MAKIWKEIELEWKGEVYTVRPTLEFINRLEQGPGNSISMLYYRASQGDLPSGEGCIVIAKTLQAAGLKDVTPEDVFEETSGIGLEFTQYVVSVLLACMPEPKNKSATGAKKKPPAKKKTRKPTGQNSTV